MLPAGFQEQGPSNHSLEQTMRFHHSWRWCRCSVRCFFRISLPLPPPPLPCTLPSTAVPKTRTVKTTKISLVGSILFMLSYVNLSLNLHFSPGRRFIECQPFRDCRRTDPANKLLPPTLVPDFLASVDRRAFLSERRVAAPSAVEIGPGVGPMGGEHWQPRCR